MFKISNANPNAVLVTKRIVDVGTKATSRYHKTPVEKKMYMHTQKGKSKVRGINPRVITPR